MTPGEYKTYAGSAGAAPRLTPTVCVHTFPLPFELWAEKMQHGAHVVTPSIRHVPPQCYDPKIKYRSRMHYYLADQEARAGDPEAIALLLDLDGNVTETSGANFLKMSPSIIQMLNVKTDRVYFDADQYTWFVVFYPGGEMRVAMLTPA